MRGIGLAMGILVCASCAAQNLVPNNSFEQSVNCVIMPGQIAKANSWTDPTGAGSDYFDSCSTIAATRVPTNFRGHKTAHSGGGYAGVMTYSLSGTDKRSYIQCALSDTLLPGKQYCVGFYVARAENTEYASNGMSACFTALPLGCSSCFLNATPQINHTGALILDTLNWTFITGKFIAGGGEKYITLGNFNRDVNTTAVLLDPISPQTNAYYYIDDVSVILCDSTSGPSKILPQANIFTPNNDGVNDVFGVSGLNIQKLNCQIFDRWGGKVCELFSPLQTWDGRNLTGNLCSDGVYFYSIRATGGDGQTYTTTGFLQLQR
jgi:gliding motility-associated-like protein